MKHTLLATLLALAANSASASVVTGDLHEVLDAAGARIGNTVDH